MDDLRHALRALRKKPGYAAVAILTLAFGIGVNVTLFSMISAFYLQPLPVKDPEQLVVVMQRSDALSVPYGHSFPDYRDYRESVTAFSRLAAYMPTPVHIAPRGGTPEHTWIEVVSPDYFAIAGVSPAFGQFPGPDDETATAPAVVLSHRYWERRLAGDPAAVGQLITLNGKPFTIVAIAAREFTGLGWGMAVAAFVPTGAIGSLMEDGQGLLESRAAHAFRMMGRLVPDKTVADARAEIEVVAARIAAEHPAEHRGSRVIVMAENRSRPDPTIAGFLPIFAVVFLGMAGLVLLIACANVANLMLARATERRRDLVIRSALGASRFRLVRLLVVESLALAAVAGATGVLLAAWGGAAIAAATPSGGMPVNDQHGADWRAYAFTFLISAAAGIVTGLWPAFKATKFNVIESLKDTATVPGSRHSLRNLLVVGQVAMSVVVLVCGGLFLQSLRHVKKLDMGFRPEGVFMLAVDLGLQQYTDDRGRRFLDELVTRARTLPGVTSASVASHVPFEHAAHFADVGTGREIPGVEGGSFSTAYAAVGAGFFDTLETQVVRGRPIGEIDAERSAPVAVVNETLARTLWPGEEAVGQRLRVNRGDQWIEVIGVARDGRYINLTEQPRPYLYLPLTQHYRSPVTLVVRTTAAPADLAQPVQRIITDLDPTLPTISARTMTRHLRDSVFGLMPLRVGAALAGAQGAIGLFLAVLGLYAVVSYSAARRVREIGVRMALGADPGDVIRLVIRDGLRLTTVGVAVGLLLAAGAGFALSRVLHGLPALDAIVFGAVTALLLAVAAAACYMPARKATRVDPLMALRTE